MLFLSYILMSEQVPCFQRFWLINVEGVKTWDVLSPLRFNLKIVTNAEHFRSGCERGFPVENPRY